MTATQLLTPQRLAAALGISLDHATPWAAPMGAAADRYGIDTGQRLAMFVAQAGHESALLTHLVENLNYSSTSLLAVFPKHFSPDLAAQYEHLPVAIANRVYAMRMGNGPEASGDGFKYRGRGLFQLTGRDDYAAFSTECGEDLVDTPDLISQRVDLAAWAASWEWHRSDLNLLADKNDFLGVTHRINGGFNGLHNRQRLWWLCKQSFGVA